VSLKRCLSIIFFRLVNWKFKFLIWLCRKRSVDFLLDIPRILHDLDHITQKSDWDCGISCVAMCLSKEQRQHFYANLKWFSCNPETGFGERLVLL